MRAYQRFLAWRVAHLFALEIYRVTDAWPAREQYELTRQLRRAALSAPTNIAEGSAKRGAREFRRFLDVALGSLAEASYLLQFARERGLLTREMWEELEELRNRAGQLTWRLYESISRRISDPPT